MSELSLFDFLPEEEAARFKPIKSTDWKWKFADYPKEKNGLKVFSCFACGGGSTMGYKLAGCEMLGCCEIDPRMNEVYVRNHNPMISYRMNYSNWTFLTVVRHVQHFQRPEKEKGAGASSRNSEKARKNRHWTIFLLFSLKLLIS